MQTNQGHLFELSSQAQHTTAGGFSSTHLPLHAGPDLFLPLPNSNDAHISSTHLPSQMDPSLLSHQVPRVTDAYHDLFPTYFPTQGLDLGIQTPSINISIPLSSQTYVDIDNINSAHSAASQHANAAAIATNYDSQEMAIDTMPPMPPSHWQHATATPIATATATHQEIDIDATPPSPSQHATATPAAITTVSIPAATVTATYHEIGVGGAPADGEDVIEAYVVFLNYIHYFFLTKKIIAQVLYETLPCGTACRST